METLRDFDSLTIREKKKYSGIPETWKLKPEFCLVDGADEEVFYVVSEKEAVRGFDFLKQAKEYTLYVVNRKGDEILCFKKNFGIFSKRAEIFDSNENLLGSIQKNPSSVRTVYDIRDSVDRLSFQIEGPAMAPEEFRILQDKAAVGRISKRWGKAMEEGVSRQAHFGVVFPMGCDAEVKGALLGALFLVDFLH